jgi:hypothetical protein
VPVLDAGISREWVDAAREAVKDNRVPSSAGHRFWELSGGIFCCGGCGRRMFTNTVTQYADITTIVAPLGCTTAKTPV